MPDNDHAPAAWQSIANTFKNDPRVILRLKEEPYPAGNTDGASASPSTVAPRQTETLTSTIQLSGSATGVTVDYEVVNSAGAGVHSYQWTGQSFTAATPRTFTNQWTIPKRQAAGTYRFQIYVRSSTGSTLGSDTAAGSFTVT